MKNPNLRGFGLIAATVMAANASRAHAQDTILPNPLPSNLIPLQTTNPSDAQWRVILLRNVSPETMAHWFDPLHNPARNQASGGLPTLAIGKTAAEIEAMLSLPKGVKHIATEDQQNMMWVYGSPASVAELAAKVALLDKPLKQVEVEAQIVQINTADAKTLGINFTRKEGRIEVGMAGADIQAKIEALIAQKKARIITTPRVTAINGVKASLYSTQTTTAVVGANNRGGVQVQPFADAVLAKGEPYGLVTTSSLGLIITPTFFPDDVISLQMGPIRTLGVSATSMRAETTITQGSNTTSSIDLDDIPTQPILLKDHQTAVLQGLKWQLRAIGSDPSSKISYANLIVLLTARILRHAGDDEVRTASLPH